MTAVRARLIFFCAYIATLLSNLAHGLGAQEELYLTIVAISKKVTVAGRIAICRPQAPLLRSLRIQTPLSR